MSDPRGHNPSTERRTPSQKTAGISLTQWLYQSIGINQGRVSSRLRGNNLHILVESASCPDASTIVPKLTHALAAVPLGRLLPTGSPQIYQVIVYGRQTNQTKPTWTESFYLNQPVQSSVGKSGSESKTSSRSNSALPSATGSIVPMIDLARSGQPDAIARYLSSTFSEVAFKARVEVIGKVGVGNRKSGVRSRELRGEEDAETRGHGGAERHLTDNNPQLTTDPTQNSKLKTQNLPLSSDQLSTASSGSRIIKRLYITCEAAYSPDPLILAEPISQRLRELELQGFRDAAVFGQVSGEAGYEWLLRVDLTPTDDILREWARWGDVQAIVRLLNRILISEEIQVSALLKDATLHLTCESTKPTTPPDKLSAIAAITPTLQSLAPQGIQAATIYGVLNHDPQTERQDSEDTEAWIKPQTSNLSPSPFTPHPSPHWVHWLNLPALNQPQLAKSTLELAQEANWGAISFLLTRLLNPNMDRMLATGGIRVQLRQKGDLLHIMTDAPTCPNQNQVGPAISRFLKPLQIPNVAGVRIYGRRAGQKQPLWSYGVDFLSRNRLVPEATPEFAASDVYVNDLLEPPGAIVLRSDLPPTDWRSVLNQWLQSAVQNVQRSLIKTQLFAPLESTSLSSDPSNDLQSVADSTHYRGAKVAVVWGAVGVLLIIQADWFLGSRLQPSPKLSAPTPSASSAPSTSPIPSVAKQLPATSTLPHLSLKKTPPANSSAFNPSGFTQPKQSATDLSASSGGNSSQDAGVTTSGVLPASPLQPKADFSDNFSPTFNSRQLDEKIALYQRYLAENGPPDVLVVGSSRALRGVDPIALEKLLAAQGYRGVKIFNFGINGATAQVVDTIVRQITPQEKLPKMILFADGARAFNSGRLDITYNGIIASEGYRKLIAGNPAISGTTVAQAVGKGKSNSTKPTSVTEEASGSRSNGYQTINRELDKRLGMLSQLYAQRDRLKTLLSEQLAALLPKNTSFIAFGGKISPGELSDATSPAASASNSPASVLTEGGAIDVNGFLPLPNRFNPVTYYQKYARVSGDYDSDYESFSLEGRQTESMVAIAQFAQAHQIPFVFVNLPLTNDYLDPIRKHHEEEFQQRMLQLSTQFGFTYRDLSMVLANQPDYFSDPSHLNRYGAYEVSRRLAEDIMIPWQKAR